MVAPYVLLSFSQQDTALVTRRCACKSRGELFGEMCRMVLQRPAKTSGESLCGFKSRSLLFCNLCTSVRVA
jgi:hypothetical protein